MIYDLNEIAISPRVYNTWLSSMSEFVTAIQAQFPDLKPEEVPDEQFRVDAGSGGVGRIFVIIRDREVALNVPPEEWGVIRPEIDQVIERILSQDNLPNRLQGRAKRYWSGKMGLASKIRLLESEGYRVTVSVSM